MKQPTSPHDDTRREMTRRFIDDYLLHSHLQQNAAAVPDGSLDDARYSSDTVQPRSSQSPADFDWQSLQPGQIRLLSQPESMCYVLILQQWDLSSYLVVPFSRFSLPATDEELLLSYTRTEYLSVLQLWNVRTLQALFLRRSWLVDCLNDDELALAQDAQAYVLTGKGDYAQFIMRMGLPVKRSFDPRLAYKESSLSHYAAIDAADFDWAEQCDTFSEEPVWNSASASGERSTTPKENVSVFLPRSARPQKYPSGFFRPLALAAAGDEKYSPCWYFGTAANKLLPALHAGQEVPRLPMQDKIARAQLCLPDFAAAFAEANPTLLWDLAELKLPPGSYDALIIHSQQRVLLGSGYALVNKDGAYLSFSDWLSSEHSAITSPADLTLLLCKEAKL
jgi:hypothetical protein